MLTRYIIPCSCGCGIEISRFIFSTHVCQVRGQRDRIKKKIQTFRVESGEEVVAVNMKEKIGKPVSIGTPYDPKGWQPPLNLSKAYFARRGKGSKKGG